MKTDWLVPGVVFALASALTCMIRAEARRRRARKFTEEKVSKWEDEGGRIPGATLSAETTTEMP